MKQQKLWTLINNFLPKQIFIQRFGKVCRRKRCIWWCLETKIEYPLVKKNPWLTLENISYSEMEMCSASHKCVNPYVCVYAHTPRLNTPSCHCAGSPPFLLRFPALHLYMWLCFYIFSAILNPIVPVAWLCWLCSSPCAWWFVCVCECVCVDIRLFFTEIYEMSLFEYRVCLYSVSLNTVTALAKHVLGVNGRKKKRLFKKIYILFI